MKKLQQLMTTKQFAEKMEVDYRTALRWLKKGIIPGAKLITTPIMTYWEIPQSAVQVTKRPKRGPSMQSSKKKDSAKKK